MTAKTRLLPRALATLAASTALVATAAGVTAFAAPGASPGPTAYCQAHWFTHPWAPGKFGAALSVTRTQVKKDFLLSFRFGGSERVDQVHAGPVKSWNQFGRWVTITGIKDLRSVPVDELIGFPMTITGTPGPTPVVLLNGRPCSVTSSTAITSTTTTSPTTTTTTPTTTTTTSGTTGSSTTTTSPYPNDSCSATYRILWQTATQFRASVTWSGNSSLFVSTQLRFVFSGDQQVITLTPDTTEPATWTQTGSEVLVEGYPLRQWQAATFTATYSGQNGPPTFVGAAFGCKVSFYPAPTTTTTYAANL